MGWFSPWAGRNTEGHHVFQLQQVSKRFGDTWALHPLDLLLLGR